MKILSAFSENRECLLNIAPAPALTYLNVFTVEECESNGKTNKRWTKIGAAFIFSDLPGHSGFLPSPADGDPETRRER